jgi:hypothetical protein
LRFQVVTDKYSQGCNNLIKPKKQMYQCCWFGLYIEWDIQKEQNPYRNNCLLRWMMMSKSIWLPVKNRKELMDIIALRCDFLFIKYQECC